MLGSQATIARLEGDEFALLFLGGETGADKVLTALERAFDVGGLHVHVDGSIGVARVRLGAGGRRAAAGW